MGSALLVPNASFKLVLRHSRYCRYYFYFYFESGGWLVLCVEDKRVLVLGSFYSHCLIAMIFLSAHATSYIFDARLQRVGSKQASLIFKVY